MGSATLARLAERGIRVLGLDRYVPPHSLGSTHGSSRIIREAYYEHPLYVPLVRRAYECWSEIEKRSGRRIYRKTGGLMLGPREGRIVGGSLASAVTHNIPHQLLQADEIRARFPGFHPPEHFVGLWEDRAGILLPEVAVGVQLDLARRDGAVVETGSPVLRWKSAANNVRVETADRVFEGDRLVIAAGPWIGSLVSEVKPLLQVERQLQHWFRPTTSAAGWPVALWEYRPGNLFATLPEESSRVKAGIHHDGELVDPETVSRQPTPEDETRIRSELARYQPGAAGALLGATVCLYTNTADSNFVMDWHRDHGNVLILSACSGHGFKFSSAIGEIAADLVTGARPTLDVSAFRLKAVSGER